MRLRREIQYEVSGCLPTTSGLVYMINKQTISMRIRYTVNLVLISRQHFFQNFGPMRYPDNLLLV